MMTILKIEFTSKPTLYWLRADFYAGLRGGRYYRSHNGAT